MKALATAALLALLAVPASASSLKQASFFGAGAQMAWFSDAAFQKDFEGRVVGGLSLSPHLAIAGHGLYGFSESYFVGDAEVQILATDWTDRTFGIQLVAGKQWFSDPAAGKDEYYGGASLGKSFAFAPSLIFGARFTRGFDTETGRASLSVTRPFKTAGN